MAQNRIVETQVLVIGGSIVGLTTALALQRHRVAFVLAEKHDHASEHPRASRYNARAMEVFRALGIEADVRRAGADLEKGTGSITGATLVEALAARSPAAGPATAKPRGPHPETLLSPAPSARAAQSKVEPVLREIASARGGDLRFGIEVLSLEQTAHGVLAHALDRKTRESIDFRARYVVAADGVRGKTREQVGIGREELGVAGHYVNILFDADLSSLISGRELGNCLLRRPGLAALMHAFDGGTRWRLQLVTREHHPLARYEPLVRDAIGAGDVRLELIDAQPWEAASGAAPGLPRGSCVHRGRRGTSR